MSPSETAQVVYDGLFSSEIGLASVESDDIEMWMDVLAMYFDRRPYLRRVLWVKRPDIQWTPEQQKLRERYKEGWVVEAFRRLRSNPEEEPDSPEGLAEAQRLLDLGITTVEDDWAFSSVVHELLTRCPTLYILDDLAVPFDMEDTIRQAEEASWLMVQSESVEEGFVRCRGDWYNYAEGIRYLVHTVLDSRRIALIWWSGSQGSDGLKWERPLSDMLQIGFSSRASEAVLAIREFLEKEIEEEE